jgi:hypothetical protein
VQRRILALSRGDATEASGTALGTLRVDSATSGHGNDADGVDEDNPGKSKKAD